MPSVCTGGNQVLLHPDPWGWYPYLPSMWGNLTFFI